MTTNSQNTGFVLGGKQLEVLQVINALKGDAFGGGIAVELTRKGSPTALPQIYSILEKLNKKGLVEPSFTAPLKSRGGRRRKVYKITGAGQRVIHSSLPEQVSSKPKSGWVGVPETN